MLAKSNTPALSEFKAANEAFKQYSVKFDAMRVAYDKAMGTTGAGEMFSPKKYSTALKSLANDPNYKKNVKWLPGEIEEMTGLANILQVVKRAGQYAENPPPGNRWGLLSALGGAEGAAYAIGGTAASIKTAGIAAGVAGVGACLGADFIKIDPPVPTPAQDKKGESSVHMIKEVVAAAGRSKVICAGENFASPEVFFTTVYDQIHIGGTQGSGIGRNIHQRPLNEAIRFANAATAIICENKTVQEALNIYNAS
jgi:hypothetical protein